MKQFRFCATGSMCGDGTTPYKIIFDEDMTVQEFVEYVLTRNEWGCIGIYNQDSKSFFGNPSWWYHQDKLDKHPLPADIMDKQIKEAKASGGWSRMDYVLTL